MASYTTGIPLSGLLVLNPWRARNSKTGTLANSEDPGEMPYNAKTKSIFTDWNIIFF